MNFKSFIKKNQSVWGRGKNKRCWINKEALGEWAWKTYLERNNERNKYLYYSRGINYFGMRDLLEVASVCLGKKEFQKRLGVALGKKSERVGK